MQKCLIIIPRIIIVMTRFLAVFSFNLISNKNVKKTFWRLLSATFLVHSAVCENMPLFFSPLCKCITFLWRAEGYFHVELDESMHFFSLQFYLLTWMTVANCLH